MKYWAIITALLLVGAALTWRGMERSSITNERFKSLESGMTQGDIEQILGGSARNECDGPIMAWMPRGDTLNSVRINPGKPGAVFFLNTEYPDGDFELVWLSETGLIAVLFDEQGRLNEKHFSNVNVMDRPTVADWIRTRF